jgi:hypothetical protein
MQAVLMIYGTALRTFNLCRHIRILLYPDVVLRVADPRLGIRVLPTTVKFA